VDHCCAIITVTHAPSTELLVTRSHLLQESLRRTAEQYHFANSLLKQKILAASRSNDEHPREDVSKGQAAGVDQDALGEACENPFKRRAVAAPTDVKESKGKTFILVF
jgi:hypothetical protein